jgi:hypothetical protein
MTFTKSEDAYTFYNDYAYIVGFSMVRWHPYKDKKDDKNGNVTRVTLKFNKFGRNAKYKKIRQRILVHLPRPI